jgi:hypothetical protein
MRRLVFAAGMLLSIGCSGEALVQSEPEPVCGWAVVALASYDEDAGDCRWSARSLDLSVARLRSADGECDDAAPICDVRVCERVAALRPREVVEVWAAPGIDAETARAATELTGCE